MPVPETVFMFSGQGSQYFQMGRELYEGNATFRTWMVQLDSVVQELSGNGVIETLYSGKHSKAEPFDRTLLSHPAIFMVEFALAQTLIQAGIRPDIVLGVSLGSFAAAAVAGCIDVEDALAAVVRQAMLIERCCEAGGMIAILADPALFAEEFLGGHSELAAVNFSSHFVISARRAELAQIETALRQQDIGYQRLPVSFPFHSQWIDEAKAPFESFMQTVRCKRGRLPMMCCDQMDIQSEVSQGYFWNVVRNPIRFRETIARLGSQHDCRYIDIGPSDTLATFVKYSMPDKTSNVHAILTPYGRDQKNLAALSASIRH